MARTKAQVEKKLEDLTKEIVQAAKNKDEAKLKELRTKQSQLIRELQQLS